MLSLKTILHPTDFSEPSDRAFQLACSLASDCRAQLVIVHLVGAPVFFDVELIATGGVEWRDALREELLELEIPDEHVNVVRKLEEGRPAAEILQLARLCRADLIVMGAHGRRGPHRLLMGSVAEEVLRSAACPVLLVRTPMAQTEGSESVCVREELA